MNDKIFMYINGKEIESGEPITYNMYPMPKRIEAVNLKICGKECTGHYLYTKHTDDRIDPHYVILRETHLYFTTSGEFTPEEHEAFHGAILGTHGITIEEDGDNHDGYLTDWTIPNEGDHSGSISMVSRYFD